MMRENAAAKAERYLIQGRVRILACDEEDGTLTAEIRGNGRIYSAGHDEAGWFCDCAARTENCAHVIALKQVTVFAPREGRS